MGMAYVYFMNAKYINYYYATTYCANDGTTLITNRFLTVY